MSAETATLAHATARRLVAEIDDLQALLRRPRLDVADDAKLGSHTVNISSDDPYRRML
jgi:hypothetical protein